eukprot:TRINITY_DN10027_c0_g1_i1.p1 TRINITY_DN10027_c0_g1~~TRINITY_DN10027_c0_g1_i1.p1  ORF type:complete len:187 (-),score=15.39 TRINITY_DN10027_c0_g1_i1:21-581(-)
MVLAGYLPQAELLNPLFETFIGHGLANSLLAITNALQKNQLHVPGFVLDVEQLHQASEAALHRADVHLIYALLSLLYHRHKFQQTSPHPPLLWSHLLLLCGRTASLLSKDNLVHLRKPFLMRLASLTKMVMQQTSTLDHHQTSSLPDTAHSSLVWMFLSVNDHQSIELLQAYQTKTSANQSSDTNK